MCKNRFCVSPAASNVKLVRQWPPIAKTVIHFRTSFCQCSLLETSHCKTTLNGWRESSTVKCGFSAYIYGAGAVRISCINHMLRCDGRSGYSVTFVICSRNVFSTYTSPKCAEKLWLRPCGMDAETAEGLSRVIRLQSLDHPSSGLASTYVSWSIWNNEPFLK